MALVEHQRGRPKYLLIADGLREKIEAGAYPVDSKLPAVHELATSHNAAPNTVRSAIGLLVREGLLESFQGDGIYVRKAADPADGQDADLHDEVRQLADRVESLELNLANLYNRRGEDYPRGAAQDGHTSNTAVAHGKRA
jgi:DNA-binding GntR family transcriptional regulator